MKPEGTVDYAIQRKRKGSSKRKRGYYIVERTWVQYGYAYTGFTAPKNRYIAGPFDALTAKRYFKLLKEPG